MALAAGEYTLTVTYGLQRFDGASWQPVPDALPAAYAWAIAVPSAADGSTPDGSASAPTPGDTAPLGLLGAAAALCLAALLLLRKKRASLTKP